MTTLAEIDAAVDALPLQDKQELLLFLASRMRAQGQPLPQPRDLPRQQIDQWIREDEASMKRLRESA